MAEMMTERNGSWWINVPREQFADVVTKELERMKLDEDAKTVRGATVGWALRNPRRAG